MSQIGVATIGTPSGPKDIAIYELGDLDKDFVRIGTPSGPGLLPIDDKNLAKYNFLRIETASGTMAMNDKTPGTMEDFESQTLDRWYISSDAPTKITSNAGLIEDYGIALADEERQSTYAQRLYSHPTEGMESLSTYPQYGERFEAFVQFTSGSEGSGHHRIGFGVADQNVGNYWGPITSDNASDFTNWFAIDMQSAISEVHIWKNVNGSRTEAASSVFNPVAGQTYRVLVDWAYTSSDTVRAEIYEYNPTGSDTHVVTISDSSTDYNTSNRGIFLESEFTSSQTYYDEIRKVR